MEQDMSYSSEMSTLARGTPDHGQPPESTRSRNMQTVKTYIFHPYVSDTHTDTASVAENIQLSTVLL